MTLEVKHLLTVAPVYLWIGFVCAISFMEARLKFRAPGVTIPIGLGIGRLVFNRLNKVEWFFAITIIASLFVSKTTSFSFENSTFFIPVILLIAQTTWLLPALDARAEILIKGQIPPPSNLHFYFAGIEVVKVISLFIFSIKQFN